MMSDSNIHFYVFNTLSLFPSSSAFFCFCQRENHSQGSSDGIRAENFNFRMKIFLIARMKAFEAFESFS
jgi:hypothetical protein